MVRLDSIQPVGSVPESASASLPILFSGNGGTYLLADALYEVQVATDTLVELLQPGETVAGAVVGPLLGGAWRGDGPIVFDSERAYTFDPVRGEWDWEVLGSLEGAPVASDVVAAGVFDLNLYIIEGATGKILKFNGGDYESAPEDWTQGLGTDELMRATDILIDGNIFVLLPEGAILKFFLNNLEALDSTSDRACVRFSQRACCRWKWLLHGKCERWTYCSHLRRWNADSTVQTP